MHHAFTLWNMWDTITVSITVIKVWILHADDDRLADQLNGRNTITVEITCLLNSLRNHALSLVTWHPPQKIKNLRPQIQLYRTKLTYFTMSSPNMNASSILRNQSSRTTSFSTNLSGMETVFVGLLQSYLYDFVIWTIEMIVPVLTVQRCKWRNPEPLNNNQKSSRAQDGNVSHNGHEKRNPARLKIIMIAVMVMKNEIQLGSRW